MSMAVHRIPTDRDILPQDRYEGHVSSQNIQIFSGTLNIHNIIRHFFLRLALCLRGGP